MAQLTSWKVGFNCDRRNEQLLWVRAKTKEDCCQCKTTPTSKNSCKHQSLYCSYRNPIYNIWTVQNEPLIQYLLETRFWLIYFFLVNVKGKWIIPPHRSCKLWKHKQVAALDLQGRVRLFNPFTSIWPTWGSVVTQGERSTGIGCWGSIDSVP